MAGGIVGAILTLKTSEGQDATKQSIACAAPEYNRPSVVWLRLRPAMSETWKQWEGQTVNGEFPLLRYLGGSRHSAVFLTRRKAGGPEHAAIKLIASDPNTAVSQMQRWKKSAEIVHPHLLRILEWASCELVATLLLYVVTEPAEE